MSATDDLLQTLLAAPPARKAAALAVLRGHLLAVEPGSQPPSFEPYLTLRETARRLGLGEHTLWRWRIPGRQFGGRRRYLLSEVTAYLGSEDFKRRLAALRAERRQKTRTSTTT